MKLTTRGAAFIQVHEGFVPSWYLDPVGIPTIGIGFTMRSDSFRQWWSANKPSQPFRKGATMTREEAAQALIFLFDQEYGRALDKHLGRSVPQNVWEAAASAVFNMGVGSLQWRWGQALRAGDIREAARLLETTGTTAKGRRLAGLVTRRREEAELMLRGDYTIGGALPADLSDSENDGVLERGERGEEVRRLQELLQQSGVYSGAVDGVFGPGTEAAVMEFQRTAGLTADGQAGPQTMARLGIQSPSAVPSAASVALFAAPAAPLPAAPTPVVPVRTGEEITNAESVSLVQRLLREKGYPEVGQVDGKMGDRTRDAITIFQRNAGLPLSGLLTAELIDALARASHRPVSESRATATEADIKDARSVALSRTGRVGSLVAGAAGAAGAITQGLDDFSLDGAVSAVTRTQAAWSMISGIAPWLIIVALAGMGLYVCRGVIRDNLKKYRDGRHV